MGVVTVPNATRWGRDAAELRELCAAMALSAVERCRPDVWRGDAGEAALIATLASVMALSDAGVAPSETCGPRGHGPVAEAGRSAIVGLVDDAEALMDCADRAEDASVRITGILARSRSAASDDGQHEDGPPSRVSSAEDCDKENRDGRKPMNGDDAYVRPPLRKPNLEAYGRYRLRDVVVESERASEALAQDGERGWPA